MCVGEVEVRLDLLKGGMTRRPTGGREGAGIKERWPNVDLALH